MTYSVHGRTRLAWRSLLLSASLLAGVLWYAIGDAHGGGTAQVTDVEAGPYRLFVWTSPDPWRAGEIAHVTVAVTLVDAAGLATPVTDATIEIRMRSDAQPPQQVTWTATPVSSAAAGFYEADGELPNPGSWTVEAAVQGREGNGTVSFAAAVQPPASVNWMLWGGGALVLLLVIGVFGTRRRKSPPRSSPAQATPAPVQE